VICISLVFKVTDFMGGCRYLVVSIESCVLRFWVLCCLWIVCGLLGVGPLGSTPGFVLL